MLSANDYQRLSLLEKNNPEIYELFSHMENEYLTILSHTCHDLLNSSGLVDSYLGLMEQQSPEITANPLWKKIKKNSANNLQVLNHIGKFRYSHTLKGIKEFTIQSLTDRIKESYPQVAIHCSDQHATIKGSFSNIQSSVEALLQNAKEAVSSETASFGTLDIHITNNFISFIVTDYGQGFSPEAIKQGFQPFYTDKSGHAGLGLSTAFQTALRHHGTLLIQSSASPTIVELKLPRKISLETE